MRRYECEMHVVDSFLVRQRTRKHGQEHERSRNSQCQKITKNSYPTLKSRLPFIFCSLRKSPRRKITITMFSLKNLSLLLTLGTTMSLASPVKRADSEALAPNDLLPFNWDNILIESGTLPNITTPEEPNNPLAKRADFCYDYWLNTDKVEYWGSQWQAATGQTWIPALQWRSWAWSDAGLKICAVNRYQEIWAGTNLADWEVGWAMKAISGDCLEGFQRTKGGRITGHGTDGRALHMYLTDVGFTCY